MTIYITPAEVIFAWKKVKPKIVMGTLFNDPTIAYVVAEVAPMHHRDEKLRKNPVNPATQLAIMKAGVSRLAEMGVEALLSEKNSSRNKQIGSNSRTESKLL